MYGTPEGIRDPDLWYHPAELWGRNFASILLLSSVEAGRTVSHVIGCCYTHSNA
jgi:hypothetical protein